MSKFIENREGEGSKNHLQENLIDVGGSAVASLVGFALGGPIGAFVGATTVPVIKTANNIITSYKKRRQKRAEELARRAFTSAQVSIDDGIKILNSDNYKADDFINLLRMVSQLDPSLDGVLGAIMGKILTTGYNKERERLLIHADAIRNLRLVHLNILKALYEANGILTAREISEVVDIPEVELRSVVRDLELRGMIKDLEIHPVQWKLRELGSAIVIFSAEN